MSSCNCCFYTCHHIFMLLLHVSSCCSNISYQVFPKYVINSSLSPHMLYVIASSVLKLIVQVISLFVMCCQVEYRCIVLFLHTSSSLYVCQHMVSTYAIMLFLVCCQVVYTYKIVCHVVPTYAIRLFLNTS